MDGGCVEERILADEQARLREFERFGQVIDAPNLNLIIYLSPASLVIVCASLWDVPSQVPRFVDGTRLPGKPNCFVAWFVIELQNRNAQSFNSWPLPTRIVIQWQKVVFRTKRLVGGDVDNSASQSNAIAIDNMDKVGAVL